MKPPPYRRPPLREEKANPESEREASLAAAESGSVVRLIWVLGGGLASLLAWEPATRMLLESPTKPTISPIGWLIAVGGSLLAAAAVGLGASRTLPDQLQEQRGMEGAYAGGLVGMLAWVFGAMPALVVLSQSSLIVPRAVGRSAEDTTWAAFATVPHDMAWLLIGLSLIALPAGMVVGALSAGGGLPRSVPAPGSTTVLGTMILYLMALAALWESLSWAAGLAGSVEEQARMGGYPSALTPDSSWVGVLVLGSGVLCGMMAATWVVAMRRNQLGSWAVPMVVLCALPGGLVPWLVAPDLGTWASPSWLALMLAGALAGAGAPLHEDPQPEGTFDATLRMMILLLWAVFGPMGVGALVAFNNAHLINLDRITSSGPDFVPDPNAVVSVLAGIHGAVMSVTQWWPVAAVVGWCLGAVSRA